MNVNPSEEQKTEQERGLPGTDPDTLNELSGTDAKKKVDDPKSYNHAKQLHEQYAALGLEEGKIVTKPGPNGDRWQVTHIGRGGRLSLRPIEGGRAHVEQPFSIYCNEIFLQRGTTWSSSQVVYRCNASRR